MNVLLESGLKRAMSQPVFTNNRLKCLSDTVSNHLAIINRFVSSFDESEEQMSDSRSPPSTEEKSS
jgi:hypothetical protein